MPGSECNVEPSGVLILGEVYPSVASYVIVVRNSEYIRARSKAHSRAAHDESIRDDGELSGGTSDRAVYTITICVT